MAFIYSNSGKTAYGVKKYIVDTVAEISTLPKNVTIGSTVFAIEDSSTYMLNNKKEWVKIIITAGTVLPDDEIPEDSTDGVLDGGTIVAPML